MKWMFAILVLSFCAACGNGQSQVLTPPLPYPGRVNTPIDFARMVTPRPVATPHAPAQVSENPDPRPTPTATPRPVASPSNAKAKAVHIRLYRTYGTEQAVYLKGRVIQPEDTRAPGSEDSSWTNLIRNLKEISVKEVAGVKIQLTLNGKRVNMVSDAEGMFQAATPLFAPLPQGLLSLKAELAPGQNYKAEAVTAQLVIQGQHDSSLAVISDIDDTIKKSDVSNKLAAAKKLLLGNPYKAEAIPGTAALYQRLEALDGKQDGDIFYLSGSPMNLADQIYSFMDLQAFPYGAVELKKWGFEAGDDNPIKQEAYKQDKLRQIFSAFPERRFLLFGDSSEKDAEIYTAIAKEFPGRVQAIFINNVNGAEASEARFQEVHLTQNASEAAEILQQMGILSSSDLASVQAQI